MNDGMGDPRSAIESRGLRCTRQREIVYATLGEMRTHPTAEELFAAAKQREPSLSLATVYNALEAFTETGLARRHPATHAAGPCRFDADTFDHVHVEFPDGRVEDTPEDISARLLASIPADVLAALEARLGVRVDRLSLHLSVSQDPPSGQRPSDPV